MIIPPTPLLSLTLQTPLKEVTKRVNFNFETFYLPEHLRLKVYFCKDVYA
jgi:hypothetical protein